MFQLYSTATNLQLLSSWTTCPFDPDSDVAIWLQNDGGKYFLQDWSMINTRSREAASAPFLETSLLPYLYHCVSILSFSKVSKMASPTAQASSRRILGVGIIGCGEITQVAHIPTLGFLSDYFQITYLCDVSYDTLEHCKNKVVGGRIPKTTRDPEELAASTDVDVVLIANSDAYHALHAIIDLKHNKFVFVEKPMALNVRDADAIISAQAASTGKVMVGYMRRYAAAFLDAIKEIGGIDQVKYARVRG
jgi:hypothetical protein